MGVMIIYIGISITIDIFLWILQGKIAIKICLIKASYKYMEPIHGK